MNERKSTQGCMEAMSLIGSKGTWNTHLYHLSIFLFIVFCIDWFFHCDCFFCIDFLHSYTCGFVHLFCQSICYLNLKSTKKISEWMNESRPRDGWRYTRQSVSSDIGYNHDWKVCFFYLFYIHNYIRDLLGHNYIRDLFSHFGFIDWSRISNFHVFCFFYNSFSMFLIPPPLPTWFNFLKYLLLLLPISLISYLLVF